MAGSGMDGLAERAIKSAGGTTQEEVAKEQERRARAEEQRRMALVACLSQDARERLARIAIVKPEKARAVEEHILRMTRGRALAEKISETQVKDLLEKVSAEEEKAKSSKIVVKRVGGMDDDLDIDDDF